MILTQVKENGEGWWWCRVDKKEVLKISYFIEERGEWGWEFWGVGGGIGSRMLQEERLEAEEEPEGGECLTLKRLLLSIYSLLYVLTSYRVPFAPCLSFRKPFFFSLLPLLLLSLPPPSFFSPFIFSFPVFSVMESL